MKTKQAKSTAKAASSKSKVPSPKLLGTLPGMTYSSHQVRFSPNEKFLASGGHGDGHRLWHGPKFKTHHKLGSDDRIATGLAFTPDSRLLAIASTGELVEIWDTATGNSVHRFKIKGLCRDVAFSPDGKRLAGAVGKAICIWDVATGALANKIDFKGVTENVEFHPDGRLIAKVGKLISITGPKPMIIENKGSPMTVKLSPDGRTLLAAGGKHHIQLWDVATGKPGKVMGEEIEETAYYASFSPDGATILTADSEGVVRLWDVATGALRTTWTGPDDGNTTGSFFSPDGTFVAAQFDEIRLYDIATPSTDAGGLPAATLPFVADEGCLTFSPKGSFLAAGSDAALMLWALR